MENGLIDRGVWSLPVCADTLFNVGQYFKDESNSKCQKYEKCSVAIISDQALKDNVESAVQRLAQQFVGSIIDFDFFKIYITSLDAFVHLGNKYNDCANAAINKECNVFAKIREKANYKHSSYEVSIYVGSVELLAIDGVVVFEGKPASCFLGSSVKPLLAVMSPSKNTISEDIYVKKQADRVIQSEKLLRQYYKVHAGEKWSFHLESLAGLGFLPLKPLRVSEHPLYNSGDSALACQSIIFKAYALRSVQNLELQKALELLKKSRPMKKFKMNGVESVASFGELKKKLKGGGKWEKVVEALALIEVGPEDMFEDDRATTVKNKKLLLSFADFGFFSSVSQKNDKTIKAVRQLFLK